MAKEVEKYSDGTPIARFPRWVYPGGKPTRSGPAHAHTSNGVLVQDQKELDALIKDRPEFGEVAEDEEVDNKSKKKAVGWDK